ncbi:amino acid ABC transporter ATP-binding protein [Vagococcus vulneris]|uniref:Polar amino acid ABC transporter ATP-binding protein n=1 Tax=Vagococcus vulneris TaxID=1977869 RepID=A0A430A2B0_9ENTE|nr:amino acid ABC transporter ATP-binding protein [Vagococcus vulneris]RSU00581.1 polar amino acid ABC transporter ATP-binding protein [Vagococcus vulneris]
MITISQLNKSYADKRIISDFNLSINDGEIVVFVGPSGGGKTTLLRCISGLESLDSGTIMINGHEVDPKNNRGRIGIVFQDFNLFPHLTVLENVMTAPLLKKDEDKAVIKKRAIEFLKEFGLENHQAYYPVNLSGGQKQRVAIVRALLMNPSILCYDEPTSALDPSLVTDVTKTIKELSKSGMTQLIVTHDMNFAKQVADKLIEVEPIK